MSYCNMVRVCAIVRASVCENLVFCNSKLNAVLVLHACWPVTGHYSNDGEFHCVHSLVYYFMSNKVGQSSSLMFTEAFVYRFGMNHVCSLSVGNLRFSVLWNKVLFTSHVECLRNWKNASAKTKENFVFQFSLYVSLFVLVQIWSMVTRVNGLRWRISCVRRMSSSWALNKSCRWGTPAAERRKMPVLSESCSTLGSRPTVARGEGGLCQLKNIIDAQATFQGSDWVGTR